MKSKIDIQPKDLKIVLKILNQYLAQKTIIWVFGSRAKNTAKKYSDLDLAIDAGKPLPIKLIVDLEFAFEESDLPYKVDIVDWVSADEQFKKIIENDRVKLELDNSTTTPPI